MAIISSGGAATPPAGAAAGQSHASARFGHEVIAEFAVFVVGAVFLMILSWVHQGILESGLNHPDVVKTENELVWDIWDRANRSDEVRPIDATRYFRNAKKKHMDVLNQQILVSLMQLVMENDGKVDPDELAGRHLLDNIYTPMTKCLKVHISALDSQISARVIPGPDGPLYRFFDTQPGVCVPLLHDFVQSIRTDVDNLGPQPAEIDAKLRAHLRTALYAATEAAFVREGLAYYVPPGAASQVAAFRTALLARPIGQQATDGIYKDFLAAILPPDDRTHNSSADLAEFLARVRPWIILLVIVVPNIVTKFFFYRRFKQTEQ